MISRSTVPSSLSHLYTVRDGQANRRAIQVCSDLSAGTRERELGGLFEAMDALEIDDGIVVTNTTEGHERIGDRSIEFVPLWRYLLSYG